ncbi:unnamed protein product [Ixodes pacificus]
MERFWIAPNPPKEFPRDRVSRGPILVLEDGCYQFLLFPAQPTLGRSFGRRDFTVASQVSHSFFAEVSAVQGYTVVTAPPQAEVTLRTHRTVCRRFLRGVILCALSGWAYRLQISNSSRRRSFSHHVCRKHRLLV